jgi:flagellar protein FlbD
VLAPVPKENTVILVHKLSHDREPFYINPDLIVSIEAHPDVVLTLDNGQKVVVAESVERLIESIREWRRSLLVAPPVLTSVD